MKKISYRIRAAWKALTACDVISISFSKNLKKCEVLTATDNAAVDALAAQIPQLASTARRVHDTLRGIDELERLKAAGEWPIKIEEDKA